MILQKQNAGLLSTAVEIYVTLCCTEIITQIEPVKNIEKKRFHSLLVLFYHLLSRLEM